MLWSKSVASPKGASALERLVDVDVTPVIANDVIYTAAYQGNIIAIGLQSGQILWKHKISAYSGLAVGANSVYVSDAANNVWSFDKDTGRVNWRQKDLTGRGITAPALVANTVVVGDKFGFMHWMSQNNGQFVAREKVASHALVSRPDVQGHDVYELTSNGRVVAYQVS